MFNAPPLPAREAGVEPRAEDDEEGPDTDKRAREQDGVAKRGLHASSIFTLPPWPADDKVQGGRRQVEVACKCGGREAA
eukprot:9585961-Alexandrium_andersonii.AAC.1